MQLAKAFLYSISMNWKEKGFFICLVLFQFTTHSKCIITKYGCLLQFCSGLGFPKLLQQLLPYQFWILEEADLLQERTYKERNEIWLQHSLMHMVSLWTQTTGPAVARSGDTVLVIPYWSMNCNAIVQEWPNSCPVGLHLHEWRSN